MFTHTRKITLFVLFSLASLACSLTALNDAPPANRAAPPDMQPGPAVPLASPTLTPAPALCVVIAHALTLRAGPGADFHALDFLAQGESLTVIENAAGWWKVTTPTGKTGYINSTYCERK